MYTSSHQRVEMQSSIAQTTSSWQKALNLRQVKDLLLSTKLSLCFCASKIQPLRESWSVLLSGPRPAVVRCIIIFASRVPPSGPPKLFSN